MKKKYRTVIIAYAVAGVAVLGGLCRVYQVETESYRREITNNYRHAFTEVASGISDIDTGLQKSLYATSPSMMAAVCTELFGKAQSAQMALGVLPLSDLGLGETASFIARVGDYAFMLSKCASSGECTDEQRENLAALSEAAGKLSATMNTLLADMDDGVLTFSELSDIRRGESAAVSSLGDGISSVEDEFPEVPALIYDGPFSEHIAQMKPVYLEGLSEVSLEDALAAAAQFAGLRESVFSFAGERAGNLPVYMLTAAVDGGEMSLEVTKAGGIVLNMLTSRFVGDAALTCEDAAKTAAAFLEVQGYADMRESYHMTQNNICTVNFAYCQDGVLCYTDLIKVSVALDTGSVTGFEALGYVMSHTVRELPAPEVSEVEAGKCVPDSLEILSHELCVIPTDGKYEVFCHEFKCQCADGRHYLVYVNAVTGQQERILILLEDENGTLTI